MTQVQRWRFGPFEVDVGEHRLLRDGQSLALTRKAFALLAELLRRPGRLVTKAELFDTVWAGTVVTDGALSRVIRELRVALDDDAAAPRYIATAHGLGFRFVAVVAAGAGPADPAAALPDAAGDFVGREAEQREVLAMLGQQGGRWITLVGPGGIGKSRLVARVVATLGDTACLLPLEDVHGVDGLAPRIAAGLGLLLPGGAVTEADTWRQLAEAIGNGDRIVALDNLEHLLPAVPALAELQRRCPHLRILATSRERTGTAGEWLVPVSGLPCPGPKDADRAEAFDAIRLFVGRARQADPRCVLGDEGDGVMARCAWLEGTPLAIELSAVWIRHFRAADILQELQAGGEMLHQPGGEGLASRQRSLAATFEHSWQLLQPAERTVLAALSVFRGGFTRPAASAVAGASLAVLTALIEKSLVRREASAPRENSAELRYGLHPLVQEFAAVKLAADPAAARAAEAAHLEHFAAYLQRLPGTGHAAERVAFRLAARAELDNLFAAWRRGAEGGRFEVLAEMATPLRVVAFATLYRPELLALFDAARAPIGRDLAGKLPLLDLSRGILCYGMGRFVEAADILKQAGRGLARSGDRRDQRIATIWLAQSQMVLGRLAPARHCIERALASARVDGDDQAISDCIGNLGNIDFQLGHFASAVLWLQESLVIRMATGGEVAMIYNNLGLAQIHSGAPETAIETLARGLASSTAERNADIAAHLHYGLAQARLALGDIDGAQANALTSASAISAGQAPEQAISTHALLARIALRRGQAPRALALLQAATREARARRLAPAVLSLMLGWTEWLLHAGDLRRARLLHAWTMAQPLLEAADRQFGDSLRKGLGDRGDAGPAVPADAAVETAVVELLALS